MCRKFATGGGAVDDHFGAPETGSEMSARLGLTASKPKRRIRPWMWWVGGITLMVALFVVWGMLNKPKPSYEFQPVGHGRLTLTVSATGTLAPRVSVDVGAEVSGRIDDLYVDFNDHVVKGQKLAQINTDQIQAQLDQTRATLMQQQATLAQTEAKSKRYAALIRAHDVSQQDFDTAKADYQRAQGGVALAAAQVQQYETQLQKATIYAPIDGVVLDRKVSKGQTVVASGRANRIWVRLWYMASELPDWKSVRPQPLISSVSPVNTWSRQTKLMLP